MLPSASELKSGAGGLRKTTTVVTQRVVRADGSLGYEKSTEHLTSQGFATSGPSVKTAAPSHLCEDLEQAKDRCPQEFCSQAGKWIDQPEDSTAATSVVVGDSPSATLRILQYNVWFVDDLFEARAGNLLAILAREEPHCAMLQEVTPRLLDLIKESPHVRANYRISDRSGATLAPYGVLMLVQKSLPLAKFTLHPLPTRMARRFLTAEIPLRASHSPRGALDHKSLGSAVTLILATAHLESFDYNQPTRASQVSAIFGERGVLPEKADAPALVFAGDTNMSIPGEEEGVPSTVVDAFHVVGSKLPRLGATCGPHRLDRIWTRSSSSIHVKPRSMSLLGRDLVPRPSDHDGLLCEVQIEIETDL